MDASLRRSSAGRAVENNLDRAFRMNFSAGLLVEELQLNLVRFRGALTLRIPQFRGDVVPDAELLHCCSTGSAPRIRCGGMVTQSPYTPRPARVISLHHRGWQRLSTRNRCPCTGDTISYPSSPRLVGAAVTVTRAVRDTAEQPRMHHPGGDDLLRIGAAANAVLVPTPICTIHSVVRRGHPIRSGQQQGVGAHSGRQALRNTTWFSHRRGALVRRSLPI
jgi:hypothetical protein